MYVLSSQIAIYSVLYVGIRTYDTVITAIAGVSIEETNAAIGIQA